MSAAENLSPEQRKRLEEDAKREDKLGAVARALLDLEEGGGE